MVDIETKSVGFEVTDESTSDSGAFPSLLKQAASKAQIEEVLGDGGQRRPELLQPGCAKLGAKPLFRVRKNAPNQGEGIPLEGGGREAGEKARPQGVEADGGLRQTGWAVETAIGSFKAMFGESVMARTVEAAQLEVGLKVAVYMYNRLC